MRKIAMSYIRPLAAIVVLAGWTALVRAQDGFSMLGNVGNNIPDRPARPLIPAMDLNPRYPLAATVATGQYRYNGNHEYKGGGLVRVAGGSYSFAYRCSNSFVTRDRIFQARWVVPGQKLEILMQRAKSSHTDTCKLSTKVLPVP